MLRLIVALGGLLLAVGCAAPRAAPLPTAPSVDLPRFMGDWYVIAHIPAALESEAYNAVESYRLEPDGRVATIYTFRKGAFDGATKTYMPTGFVRDPVHRSTWGMQFLWPFEAEYLISYLDPDYTRAIVGRNARDLVWIMARTPSIPEAEYESLVARVREWGYDVGALRRVPQRW